MSESTGTVTTQPKIRGHDSQGKNPTARSAWPRAIVIPAVAAGAALASITALAMDLAPRAGTSAFERNLAALSGSSWSKPFGQQSVSNGANRSQAVGGPTVGDEGFWLSRQDVAGQMAGIVAVGDHISIDSRSADQASAKSAVFEVIELKPLNDAVSAALTPTGTVPGASMIQAVPALTVVICREQTQDTATPPRIVRFLMETAPSGAKPQATGPRTL